MSDGFLVLAILAAVSFGTPIAVAAIGEILAERSGVMNLGVEGLMLVGAVVALWASNETNSVWMGVLAAMIAGGFLSLMYGIVVIGLRGNQIISGLALVVLGSGLSIYLGRLGAPPLTGLPARATFIPVFAGSGAELGVVGALLLRYDAFVYASWLLVGLTSFYLFRTRVGLACRAVGEAPGSADAAGINVVAFRYMHVVLGGALGAAGGAYYSLGLIKSWQEGMTAGAGWIAIALVIFSGWRPWWVLFAAYIFGGVTRLNFTLQTFDVNVPVQLLAMVPFALTIGIVILTASTRRGRRLGAPAGLGRAYVRESPVA